MRRKRNGKSARSKPKTKRASSLRTIGPDAISLLKRDHREVEAMFAQFEKVSGSVRKRAVVQKICDALLLHTMLEEVIFYPPARAALKRAGENMLDEAVVEHEGIKWRISLLKRMQPGDDLYAAEVRVLAEYVRHHVKEEEYELFPKLGWTDFDNAGVGERLVARKEKMTGKPVKMKPSFLERAIDTLVGPSPGTI